MPAFRAAALFILLGLACSAAAWSHPLGNFTINHLARVNVSYGIIRVHYVLDVAEIPTFQLGQTYAGMWNRRTLAQFASDETSVVLNGVRVSVDAAPASLALRTSTATTRAGAGGLPILRWVGEFTAAIPAGPHAIALDDRVYADRRIGWKDVLAGSQAEPTHDLRSYPSALMGSPRRIASIAFKSDGSRIWSIVRAQDAAPVSGSTASGWLSPTILADMFSSCAQTPLFVLLTTLAAFGLGALHAVEPGHGKALLAFTLVGARATSKQALILAASLTFAHTIGVFILGAALFLASGFVSESIYPWITLVSGAIIAIIGARSLARFVHSRRGLDHDHEHAHDGAHSHLHEHHHDHDHDLAGGHGHSHAIPGSQPLRFSNAVWAAMSGGIAPCPAAIVVLLAALRLHHLPYGILLIFIFSIGLASVLSGLGLGVVCGAEWLSSRPGYARIAAYGPLLTACVISTIGSVMLAQGLKQQGAAAPIPVLSAIAIAGIAGFAVSQHAHHRHHSYLQTEAGTA